MVKLVKLKVMASNLIISRRNRRTPFTESVENMGVTDYSIVNHTLLPKSFGKPMEDDYWHLKENVQLWDVGCQRQVEIRGPDAAYLVQFMTPRDLRKMNIGQCFYLPLIDNYAGLLNDPILIKRGLDWFWFSIADSDVLFWAKGLAIGLGLNVEVSEPDVWPLAVQGPKAESLIADVFGNEHRETRYFEFKEANFYDRSLVIARTGYCKQGGYEIYLDKGSLGSKLWNVLWGAGGDMQISPGYPNLIERIESGLLSYGNEMTRENNPLEINLDRFCHLNGEIEYVGQSALELIAMKGPSKRVRGISMNIYPCPSCGEPWPVTVEGLKIGQITSAIWSPLLNKSIGLSLILKDYWNTGTSVSVAVPGHGNVDGVVQDLPFI